MGRLPNTIRANGKLRQRLLLILVTVSVAGIGTYLLISSKAAGPFASITADQGTLSGGAAVTSDSTASGGKRVVFGGSSGQVPLNSADFDNRVSVGSGFVEASARQVVRTSNDVVYVITASDSSNAGIHVWKGSPAGIPTSFAEVDAANHPKPTGETLGSPDTRLDSSGIIQMAYSNAANHNLYYNTFNTNTDKWGTAVSLAANAATGQDFTGGQARTGNVALVLDGSDRPNLVYTTVNGSVLYLAPNGSGGFAAPVTIASGLSNPIHPALAMDGAGVIQLTWADNTAPIGCTGCGGTNSPSADIKYSQRTTGGTWITPETVASGANAVNNNIYLDQGPNIVTNSNNVPYVEYVDAGTASGEIGDNLEIRYRTATNTWTNDSPSNASYGYTHTPNIYSRGTDIYALLGHDQNIHYGFLYQLGGAGNAWAPFVLLDSSKNDGSASVRWDPARETDNRVIDTIYFNETTPEIYYMAIQPR